MSIFWQIKAIPEMRTIVPISLLLFMLTSCFNEPEACFTVDATDVKIFEAITLNNCSENAKKYEWTIEDGDSDRIFDDEDPLVSWSNTGEFSIRLIASNSRESKSDEIINEIVISDYCYSCSDPSFPGSSITICASEFERLQDLNFTVDLYESGDYVCTIQ
ncbi:MAG: hypothetical protein HN542_05380 [Flavobacteriales bacterium]|jgi:hypothetical protein|nr:hypothetical protein [Flavobacteriales bacterium]MBT3963160.1 hypothetical protein [Flavobacteriales bacterium]MBT4930936.1 hypothetical protein [Flavobacteriales bacterium]MBT6382852.1 hypothetical protein [Flavobacteriales bacterium]MBT6917760.1 hypothetical protein [Flavobacteriales bacterium]